MTQPMLPTFACVARAAYPDSPGARNTDTSRDAARSIDADSLQNRIYYMLWGGDYTPDEMAKALSESVLAIRPRFSELKRKGLILDTGKRRPNASGRLAIVWRLA